MGAEAEQTALNVTVCPAEVRCRGFIGAIPGGTGSAWPPSDVG